jgi:3-hydroxyisobutyrate dehydrogenase-like beta-hydroxyacid dehydrogenase
MGHAVGGVLREGGLRVITCLKGRSPRTVGLAAKAQLSDVPDYETLVTEADVVLSIIAPAQARDLAEQVAQAAGRTRADLLFVECNAIAPQTVREIGAILAGVRVVDGGIIGSPPRRGEDGTRLYVSGPQAATVSELAQHGLDVRVIGSEIGQASGLKMCYAALTKGLTALATELSVAGETMGLREALLAELRLSQGTLLQWIERQVPTMPPKASRWVGEMEEIAATFDALGLTPRILEGAAAMYRLVEGTPLGAETPEARRRGQTLDDVVRVLAETLVTRANAPRRA